MVIFSKCTLSRTVVINLVIKYYVMWWCVCFQLMKKQFKATRQADKRKCKSAVFISWVRENKLLSQTSLKHFLSNIRLFNMETNMFYFAKLWDVKCSLISLEEFCLRTRCFEDLWDFRHSTIAPPENSLQIRLTLQTHCICSSIHVWPLS